MNDSKGDTNRCMLLLVPGTAIREMSSHAAWFTRKLVSTITALSIDLPMGHALMFMKLGEFTV